MTGTVRNQRPHRGRKTAGLLAAALLLGNMGALGGFAEETETFETQASAAGAAAEGEVLRVGTDPLSGDFSPFFANRAGDAQAAALTQEPLFALDRTGGVVFHGIEGETVPYGETDYTYYGPADCAVELHEDGTVDYTIRLREDLVFSDGEPVTADDVIFDLYVRCDPSYDGSSALREMPIEGLDRYRSGMHTLFELLTAAGEDNTDFSLWSEEEQKDFFEDYNQAALAFVQEIMDYCKESGANGPDDTVAQCAASWGYRLPEDAEPKLFWDVMASTYHGDIAAMAAAETAGSSLRDLMRSYDNWQIAVKTGPSENRISGIARVDSYSVRVTATQMDARLAGQLADAICPLHYYGDEALYDYDAASFGFVKGDLSAIRSRSSAPVGMGPYRFVRCEDGAAWYEANETYYRGTPRSAALVLTGDLQESALQAMEEDRIDAACLDYDKTTAEQLSDVLRSSKDETYVVFPQNYPGFGYIGLNASNVSVGGTPASAESANLRKAFATLFAAFREEAIAQYYGEWAQVIEYPVSSASWAAPQPGEQDYETAFAKDASGNALYTEDMRPEERRNTAQRAALGFFEAAGCTVENGTITNVPEGMKTEYHVWIPAEGNGNHPCYAILAETKEILAEMGITLSIIDLKNVTDLWNALRAEQVDMWCAAWSAEADPDLYSVYFADAAHDGKDAGTSAYMYGIKDLVLDEMIKMAREGDTAAYRKALYKACFDTIMEWACVVPVYQRRSVNIFSAQRINPETIPADLTAFCGWDDQIWQIGLQE